MVPTGLRIVRLRHAVSDTSDIADTREDYRDRLARDIDVIETLYARLDRAAERGDS